MLPTLKKTRAIIAGLIGIPLLLELDSPAGDALIGHGQLLANVLVFMVFVWAYRESVGRVRRIMLIGMIVGMGGEIFFSLVLGMYHYRLGNVPIWVAFGHGLIYSLVFRLVHKDWIRKSGLTLSLFLLAFAVLYSLLWLVVDHDWYGFACTLVFLMVLAATPKSRLFFLIMYAVVAYIEQVGTGTGCWSWPFTTFGMEGWLASGNPPSGIAAFYFLFDAAVLWIYLHLLRPQTRLRYQALRN